MSNLHCRVILRAATKGLLIAGTVITLSGCIATFSPPERLIPISAEFEAIRHPDLVPNFFRYERMGEAERVAYRNALIEARLRATDIQYSAYEAALTQERQISDLSTGAATIGLTGAATLIDAVGTKNILTTVAGGITGVNGIFNDKVLLSKTIQVLQHQMRAERDRVATKIYKGLRQSSLDYSLVIALSDAEDYYRAGTMSGALIDIAGTVSKEAAVAKAEKDSIVVSFGFATDNAADVLREFVWPGGGEVNKVNRGKLNALLATLDPTIPLSAVIDNPELKSLRDLLLALAIQKKIITKQ
jgi:hypothetical protein